MKLQLSSYIRTQCIDNDGSLADVEKNSITENMDGNV